MIILFFDNVKYMKQILLFNYLILIAQFISVICFYFEEIHLIFHFFFSIWAVIKCEITEYSFDINISLFVDK